MRYDLTELVFVLDRSGSMHDLAKDAIGGYNSTIEKQKKEEGEARVTTVLFDDTVEKIVDCAPIAQVAPLTSETYYPRGCTALLDALGRTIDEIGARLAATPEEERPANVVFVVMTDGYENASREYSLKKVREMIALQQNTYSWTFIFLGANMDAVSEAGRLGVDVAWSRTYSATSGGQSSAYMATSKAVSSLRAASYSFANSRSSTTANEALGHGRSVSMSVDADSAGDYRRFMDAAKERAANELDGVE